MKRACPKCGSRRILAYKDEADPFRVYMCQKKSCGHIFHPPGCTCGRCPRPRWKA